MFKRRVYLDFASATPTLPSVALSLAKASLLYSGNPSAVHEEGRRAYRAIARAREKIARTLATKADELIFTSGGTEANNLAIRGLIAGIRRAGIPYTKMHIITTTIEHSSVIETARLLEKEGVRVSWVSPDMQGIVSPESIAKELSSDTVLVTMAHVNSEIGVIQPLSAIGARLRESRSTSPILAEHFPGTSFPVFHADAAQSPLYLDPGPHALKADMVTYDAQKILGPKGAGVLYRDFSTPLSPILGGGSQERNLRPGTENAPAIVGASVAFEYVHKGRRARADKVSALRDRLIHDVLAEVPDARLIGHPRRRIANNAFFAIPGIDGDYLAVLMDQRGVAVTPRSACVGAGGGRSEVVFALTHDEALARGTIRFSLGPKTTKEDLRFAVAALKASLAVIGR